MKINAVIKLTMIAKIVPSSAVSLFEWIPLFTVGIYGTTISQQSLLSVVTKIA